MIILIVLGLYTNNETKVYQAASTSVTASLNIIAEAQEVLNNVQDIETAYRGYVITNDSSFLHPLLVGQKVLKIAQNKLQNMPLSAAQRSSLDSIKNLIAQKNEFAYTAIVKRKYVSFEAAQQFIQQGEGNRLMAYIRYSILKFINAEKNSLDNKAKIEQAQLVKMNFVVILGVIISILILIGTLLYVLGIYKRLRNTENRLLKSQMRLENILDMLPVGILIVNAPLKQYHANNRAIEILGGGIQNDGLMTELILDKGSTQKPFNASLPDSLMLNRALSGEENIGVNDLVIFRNNKEIPLRVSTTPLYNEDGEIEYAVSVFDDITNIKKVENDLKEANRLVAETLRLKDTFLANMSHEIRTPMNAILGFTELLSRKDIGAMENEYVQTIHSSGESLLRLLNDILDFSKLEANMMHFEDHPISIQGVFNSIYTLYSHKAKNKDIQLVLNYDPTIPEYIVGDPLRLTQIITNILGNGIKFTDRGSVLISVKKTGEIENKTILEFKIKDSGIGIPKDKIQTVFMRFEQGAPNMTRQYGGTGIGLSIAKQLIELQGGSIDVTSEVGLGSIFTFIIPFRNYTSDDFAHEMQNEPLIDYDFLRQLNILLAEDNPINAKLTESIFKEQNIALTVAVNGLEALEKVRKNKYDLILMDIEMPEMNGYDTARIIRKEMQLSIPIIAMTAHALAGEKERCLQVGMNDYLTKPVNIKELFGKVYAVTLHTKTKEGAPPPPLEVLPPIPQANPVKPVATPPAHTQEKAATLPRLSQIGIQKLSLEYLREVSGNNKSFEKEMLEMLLTQVPEQTQNLEEAYANMNFDAIKAAAHKLKSSVSILGAAYLRPYLDRLEQEAKTYHIADASKEDFPDIISRLYMSLHQVKELLEQAY